MCMFQIFVLDTDYLLYSYEKVNILSCHNKEQTIFNGNHELI